ncbi:hypothetical protein SAMN04487926_11853 [Paraburkholderia steynii]|uniref:Cupin 2 conserved barrel domain-containing protein n=1 Tax=Paraburkholderia steynii TaxID=1245441 RepID=A0A7Z7BB91_9BURK|nr:cupin domain-containing protein [Paraburkholderia steynii]SDI50484.1 hypothetical protein SAMN04487926_11853 [Paraburkholderia steynii]
MNVTRFSEAPEYSPPNHFNMRCVRLQGYEAGPSDVLWLGVSIIEPGGFTTLAGSPAEKHYVVLDGAVTVQTDDGDELLERYDSCRLAASERRALFNHTDRPALILLAMPRLEQ